MFQKARKASKCVEDIIMLGSFVMGKMQRIKNIRINFLHVLWVPQILVHDSK